MTIHEFSFTEDPHEYRVAGHSVKSLTQILREAGLVDYSLVPPAVLESKRLLGTYVHQAAELLFRNDLDVDALDEDAKGYVRALSSFVEQTGFRPDPKLIEQPMMGSVLDYLYGCKPDVVGTMHGQPYILELKCCARQEKWWGPQLAGQSIALGSHRDFRRWRLVAVQLTREGRFRLHPYSDPRHHERIFTAAVLATHEPSSVRGVAAKLALEQWKGVNGKAAHA